VASAASADHVLLRVNAIPQHGLAVKPVDLTAAAHRCGVSGVYPAHITATDLQGNSVPFQFVPNANYDPQSSITGFIVARLSPDKVSHLKLEFGSTSVRPASPPSIETSHYTIFHNPQRGGLPAKVIFAATGKVFKGFRWQDRVYHKELGGFTLQNDTAASIEYIAVGPLCTAVRVKAKYVNSAGKPPASEPEATYHWIYFHDLPLVFVTAEIKQAELFGWNELHFLELNFPGQDFKSWAGGEPLGEGRFQATGRSHHATKWGALVEGRDAIAMFDCGRLIFHDGRGGYGTYLHAHSDRAWSGWSKARTRFSAWLWIGSADKPAQEIQALITQSPAAEVVVTTADVRNAISSAGDQDDAKWRSAMARQLEAAGRLEQAVDIAQGRHPSNWMRVEAGALDLVLEKAEEGMHVLSLFDNTAGKELLAPNTPSLFSLELRHAKTEEHVTLAADSGWRRIGVSDVDISAD
jgi:hypothetical protein